MRKGVSDLDTAQFGRRMSMEEIDKLKNQLEREQISVNELSLHSQDLEKRVKELEARLTGVLIMNSIKPNERIKKLEAERDHYRTLYDSEVHKCMGLESDLRSGKLCCYPLCLAEKVQLENRVKELQELTKDMGSDQTLAESLYAYHSRAEKEEARMKDLEAEREFLSKELIKSRKMIIDCNERIDELEAQVSYEQDRNQNNVGQADEQIRILEEGIKQALDYDGPCIPRQQKEILIKLINK